MKATAHRRAKFKSIGTCFTLLICYSQSSEECKLSTYALGMRDTLNIYGSLIELLPAAEHLNVFINKLQQL